MLDDGKHSSDYATLIGPTCYVLEAFLDREQERYRGQLERYAAVLCKLDTRPIRLELYFPLLGGWREWEAG